MADYVQKSYIFSITKLICGQLYLIANLAKFAYLFSREPMWLTSLNMELEDFNGQISYH